MCANSASTISFRQTNTIESKNRNAKREKGAESHYSFAIANTPFEAVSAGGSSS